MFGDWYCHVFPYSWSLICLVAYQYLPNTCCFHFVSKYLPRLLVPCEQFFFSAQFQWTKQKTWHRMGSHPAESGDEHWEFFTTMRKKGFDDLHNVFQPTGWDLANLWMPSDFWVYTKILVTGQLKLVRVLAHPSWLMAHRTIFFGSSRINMVQFNALVACGVTLPLGHH